MHKLTFGSTGAEKLRTGIPVFETLMYQFEKYRCNERRWREVVQALEHALRGATEQPENAVVTSPAFIDFAQSYNL